MFGDTRTEPKVAINSRGFKQYFGSYGTEQCLACKKPYINEGEGILCEDHNGDDDEGQTARTAV